MRRLYHSVSLVAVALCLCAVRALGQSGPGSALTFGGGSDYVSVPSGAALNAYPITVTAWVRTSQNDSTYRGIVGKASNPATNGYALTLQGGHVCAAYARNTLSYVLAGTNPLDGGSIADGAWHHVALVVNASGGKLYVDGTLKASQGWTGTAGACTTSSALLFGRYLGANISGTVDEITVWNMTLTQAEIQAGMHSVLSGSEAGLVGYWRLDAGSGTVAINSATSGSTYDGALVSSPTWVASTAPLGLPVVTTTGAAAVRAGSATLQGSALANFQATMACFQYGTTTSYGATTAATNINSASATPIAVSTGISGLAPATLYHFQLVATNSAGTNYGADATFTTLATNANLAALTSSAGTFSPAFAPATTSYSVSVANSVGSVTVTPTVADSAATVQVRVNGGSFAAVASGTTSAPLALNVGANPIEVKVTAQDGTTTKTYTLTVTRAPDANADLAALTLSTGSLAPAFSSDITSYTASVAACVSPLTVTATAASGVATLQASFTNGYWIALASGAASPPKLLKEGVDPVLIKVTAQSGATRTYTIALSFPPRVAPVALAGGPYVVPAGSPLVLAGVVSDADSPCYNETVAAAWYLRGGPAPDFSQASGTLPWASLQALSLPVNVTIPIRLTATDSQGLTAESWTALTITFPYPVLSCPSALPGGSMRFSLNLNSNVPCQIQASTNLVEWAALATLTNDLNSLLYTDLAAGNFPRRFYRAAAALPTAPLAHLTANPNPTAPGQPTLFSAGGSLPGLPGRAIVAYHWDFGDGTQGSGAMAYHTYTNAGTFNPILSVTDIAGCTNQIAASVSCQFRYPPEARPYYDLDYLSTLHLLGYDSSVPEAMYGNHIVSYEWDVNGDGTFNDTSGIVAYLGYQPGWGLLLQSPSQYPADPWTGLPNVPLGLKVTDASGVTSISRTPLTIYSSGPGSVPDWSPQPAVPIYPNGRATVHLDASVSFPYNPAWPLVAWTWLVQGTTQNIFGEVVDMEVDLNPLPVPFPAGGIKRTLALWTTNVLGFANGAAFDVTFNQLPSRPPTIGFNVSPFGIYREQGEGFALSAAATSDPDGDWIRHTAWDVNGDGVDDFVWNRTDTNGDGQINGADASPTYALQMTWEQMRAYSPLQAVGDHLIRLTVTDSTGVSAYRDLILHVRAKALIANAIASPSAGSPRTVFTFDGSQSRHSFRGQSITTWQWDLDNDGIFETVGQTVTRQFSSLGNHTVALKVSDALGHWQTNSVTVSTSQRNLSPVPMPGGPYTLSLGSGGTLDASASFEPDAAVGDRIVSYAWDLKGTGQFNDVISAQPTCQVPASVSAALGLGIHRISLRATDTFGAAGTASTTITVTAP